MTDKEKLIELLKSFGVPFKEERCKSNNGWYEGVEFGNPLYEEWEESDKVSGYYGFYTHFEFDETGKFICVGAWE